MTLEAIASPSPNFDARARAPDMIVLHYTGMPTGAAALARLRDPAAKVSAHWLIEEDGRKFRLVDEERRAWHAGRSFWAGESDINGVSIGVEIANPGHEFGYRDFPEAQIAAVVSLLDAIRGRWTVPDSRILGHSDVAPSRKQDPGERFPWARLASAGHGVWPASAPRGSADARGAAGADIAADLIAVGYDPALIRDRQAGTAALVAAFQRHWAPHRWDGVVDAQTSARVRAVRSAMAAGTMPARGEGEA